LKRNLKNALDEIDDLKNEIEKLKKNGSKIIKEY
jgi:hypothetical protein